MVAEALGSPLPLADDRLAPGADPSTLMKAAAETGAGCVVLVGHMPDVGVLAGSVARSPSLHLSPAAAVVFSTGGRGELEMEAVIDPEEA
jgi:phosphohistidine phosphatase SixA